MIIREELREDIPGIHTVEREAFGREAEADLVDKIRENGHTTLSIVALDNEGGEILAHVLFSPVVIHSEEEDFQAIGMGPVAVLPGFQKQGLGSKLVREGLDKMRQAGHEIVVVEGSPGYYSRFGFRDASTYGLSCQFDPPPGCFMALELKPGALAGKRGKVYYTPEFQEVE